MTGESPHGSDHQQHCEHERESPAETDPVLEVENARSWTIFGATSDVARHRPSEVTIGHIEIPGSDKLHVIECSIAPFGDHNITAPVGQHKCGHGHAFHPESSSSSRAATAGGTAGRFRENRVDYFLKHPSELVAVGGLAVVFGAGAENQTTPATAGGQCHMLSRKYLASPAPLP